MRLLPNCHVLLDPAPNRGSWNMAVDEALLEAALARNEAFVRWYRWSEATVSLGYFQAAEQAAREAPQLAGLPMVRRLTGGGALLHHHELTYSCVIPPGHPLAQQPRQLYETVHEGIREVLARHGIAVQMRGTSIEFGEQPFLCFGRGDPRDVVLGDRKVLGSAQRRRRGAVLQHGALILRRSPLAPQFPGILDLCERPFGPEHVPELATELASRLGDRPRFTELAAADRLRAAELERDRYTRIDWRSVDGASVPGSD